MLALPEDGLDKPKTGREKRKDENEKLQTLFLLMSAFAFSKNIERLNSNHGYHEGLQRLARGVLPPLLSAIYIIWKHQTPAWLLPVVFFIGLAASACWLVYHSVDTEYRQLTRYFLVLKHIEQRADA
jgi:hypothetical protein